MGTSEQIAKQCDVVAALATALAQCHADYAKLVRAECVPESHEIIGRRSAALMEYLGNTLNGMDAVVAEDEWMDPVFDEAQKLYPFERNRRQTRWTCANRS